MSRQYISLIVVLISLALVGVALTGVLGEYAGFIESTLNKTTAAASSATGVPQLNEAGNGAAMVIESIG